MTDISESRGVGRGGFPGEGQAAGALGQSVLSGRWGQPLGASARCWWLRRTGQQEAVQPDSSRQVREKHGENGGKNQGNDKGKGQLQISYTAGTERCQRCPGQEEPCDESFILERITFT